MNVKEKLQELKLQLPEAREPLFDYVPVVVTGNLAFVSGQIARVGADMMHKGRVGDTVTAEQASACAEICVLQALSQLEKELGSLDRIKRVVNVRGFINAVPTFTDHSKVLDSASKLLGVLFGQYGKHSRSALGAGSLPQMAPLEMEFVFEIFS